MRVLDILNGVWALPPEKLSEMVAIYCAHVRGEKIDLKAVEAQLGRPLENEQARYEIVDGVALVSVEGVIAKRMNMFSRISGGASTELIAQDLRNAIDDPRVHAVILRIDSPGGAVDGTQTLADLIHGLRGVDKPVVAWGDGYMTSGAYWIGSAAEEVYISGDTVITGSIGVAMQHVDVSRYEEKIGIKTTDIYSGKFKRIASEHAPLSEAGRAHLQALSDQMYTVFVEAVARNRGVSVETVLEDMAEGQLFVGRAAIDAGLVDGVSTLEALIADLKAGRTPAAAIKTVINRASASAGVPIALAGDAGAGVPEASAGDAPTPTQTKPEGIMTIDLKYLNANCADLVAEILAEGHAAGRAEGLNAGAQAERERIQSVEAQALPGHGELINRLKFDGKTTGPEAAAQVLAAERGKLGQRTQDILADAASLAGAAPTAGAQGAPGTTAQDPQPEDSAEADDDSIKAAWDKDAALRAEFGQQFASYSAFRKAEAKGQVKVLGKKAA